MVTPLSAEGDPATRIRRLPSRIVKVLMRGNYAQKNDLGFGAMGSVSNSALERCLA